MLTHGFFKPTFDQQNTNQQHYYLRKATVSDQLELSMLAKMTYKETYPTTFTDEELETYFGALYQKKLPQEFADPHIHYLVYENNNRLIGYAKLIHRENYTFLDKLYLLKAHQGAGLGKKMLIEVYQQALAHGHNEMRLRTAWDEKNNAIAFYEKHGFKQGEKVNYVTPTGKVTEFYDVEMTCDDISAALAKHCGVKKETPRHQ